MPIPSSDMAKACFNEWENAYRTAVEFGITIARFTDQLSAKSVDAILIYITKEYYLLISYSQGLFEFNWHDYVKANAM